jgi:zinc protease
MQRRLRQQLPNFVKSLIGLVFLLTQLLALTGVAETQFNLPVVKYKLANGLTVLLLEDHSIPLISYHTWYKVGSADEWKGVTGAAHMLEHMMFQGSKNYSREQYAQILADSGVSHNAFTTNDFTGFFQDLPSNQLETVMKLEIDRMSSVLIKQENLNQELQVVKEERRMRYENSPEGMRYMHIVQDAFAGTTYGIPTIGTMEDINAYTSEKLRFFWEKYYKPNNAVLVLVGDFKIDETKALIEKYYGTLKAGDVPQRKKQSLNMNKAGKTKTVKWPFAAKLVSMHYPAVAEDHPDAPAIEILAAILSSGDSSRLPWKFVQEDQSAIGVSAHQLDNKDVGAFAISFTLKPTTNAKSVVASTKKMIQDLAKTPPSAEEMTRAKNRVQRDWLDQMLKLGDRAQLLASYEIQKGDYMKFFEDYNKLQDVSAADVSRVATKYLKEKQLSVIYFENDGGKK